ncbi:hypothetical protein GCM10020254_11110 [Streptomyces goshikiensis]
MPGGDRGGPARRFQERRGTAPALRDGPADITLCRTADDRVYYHGGLLDRPDTMTIPATRTDTGYRASRGDYLYEIDGDRVRVTVPDGTTSSYRLTDVTDAD